ncbi:lipase family protein [Synechococcus moorigangaii CMS01]|nr:lipase family protein [Synechococcus moorigangaii CMS01]
MHEYLIYIHGVSTGNNQTHTETYRKLHEGIGEISQNFPNRSDWEKAKCCNVEWGWQHNPNDSLGGDHLLAEAQAKLAKKILPKIQQTPDWTIHPARLLLPTLRELMIRGFSDMFYYVSQDGKKSIRRSVSSQIIQCIQEPLEKNEPISLTFLGHSAGAVIAFDFLFYLFAPQSILDNKDHDFIETSDEDSKGASYLLKDFEKLRKLADNQKLRVRRLFTFGAPISMLAFRSNAVVDILAQGNSLNPYDYGLAENPEVFGPPLDGARWINFWDKDDIISWPVECLMQKSDLVKDVYMDIGDGISTVHNVYWHSKKMYQNIAALW